jgi:formylglycine-generating enzyme required for sulfatase activity
VPRDLSVICLKAMEKRPEKRYDHMKAFADDLRRYLKGDVILAKPAGPGTRLWKRMKRNPVLSAASSVASAALLAFAFVVPWVVAQTEKRYAGQLRDETGRAVAATVDAEEARIYAEEQARISEENYARVLGLSDEHKLDAIEKRADRLWPAHPEMVPHFEAWIADAEAMFERLTYHRRTLALLRDPVPLHEGEGAPHLWRFDDVKTQWQHEAVKELIARLEALAQPDSGLLKRMKDRLAFASTIRQRSIDDHQEAWDRAIALIADEGACPAYKGLRIKEQLGLVPIGQDPESGLFEFAHLQTGEIPKRTGERKLEVTGETALVFVLIPGDTFQMGSRLPRNDSELGLPNVDPYSDGKYDEPVHPVDLKPFLLSKYEMTQGQWKRIAGENPSFHPSAKTSKNEVYRFLHPVDTVTWTRCVTALSRMGLRLPSESEWEYAARAGTTSVFGTGGNIESLRGTANIKDPWSKVCGDFSNPAYKHWLDNRFIGHAPVGCFKPNAFGLHDVIGNMYEYVRDTLGRYDDTPRDGSAHETGDPLVRVSRGGCFNSELKGCRMAGRGCGSPHTAAPNYGVRPAASLQ